MRDSPKASASSTRRARTRSMNGSGPESIESESRQSRNFKPAFSKNVILSHPDGSPDVSKSKGAASGSGSGKSAAELVQELITCRLRAKEKEVETISKRIREVQQNLQLVRYGAVSMMSNQTTNIVRPRVKSFWNLTATARFFSGTNPRSTFNSSSRQNGHERKETKNHRNDEEIQEVKIDREFSSRIVDSVCQNRAD